MQAVLKCLDELGSVHHGTFVYAALLAKFMEVFDEWQSFDVCIENAG